MLLDSASLCHLWESGVLCLIPATYCNMLNAEKVTVHSFYIAHSLTSHDTALSLSMVLIPDIIWSFSGELKPAALSLSPIQKQDHYLQYTYKNKPCETTQGKAASPYDRQQCQVRWAVTKYSRGTSIDHCTMPSWHWETCWNSALEPCAKRMDCAGTVSRTGLKLMLPLEFNVNRVLLTCPLRYLIKIMPEKRSNKEMNNNLLYYRCMMIINTTSH